MSDEKNLNYASVVQKEISRTRKLEIFKVTGLFDLFDHEVIFKTDAGITIIYAPNGYGKTIILKLIAAFFGGTLRTFREIWFEKIFFAFDDKSYVVIEQRSSPDEVKRKGIRGEKRYSIRYISDDTKIYDPWNADEDLQAELEIPHLDRYVSFLSRIDASTYIDLRVGEKINSYEAMNRSWGYLPPSARRTRPIPKWLEVLRSSIECRLIDTQRLLTRQKKEERDWQTKEETNYVPAVKSYSDDIAAAIERKLAEYANLSSSLDRTFPNRLLSSLHEENAVLSESELRQKLFDFESKRTQLAAAGLLFQDEDQNIISQDSFDLSTRRILTSYVNDTSKKLDVFDDLYKRISLFLHIINSRFQFKSISLNRIRGFEFRDVKNRRLTSESLSSGEQHELVLIYELIFRNKKNTLLLIDEPEISLHVAWQKGIMSDLREIIALSPIDVVLATHSPQLLAGNLELAVQLNRPAEARLAPVQHNS